MPNVIRITSPYIKGGNPDTYNEPAPSYAAGELGMSFDVNDRSYEKVILDSGATVATPTGVVAANQIAYWVDPAKRIVTNDRRVALGNAVAQASCNFAAGIFRTSVTAGYECCILTRGKSIPIKAGTVSGAGQLLVSDVDANGPQALGTAVGTAPSYRTIGTSLAAAANGNVTADVDFSNAILP